MSSQTPSRRHRSDGTSERYRAVETLLRRAVLLLPPLVMSVLAYRHPTEHNEHDGVAALAPVAGEWLRLHLLLLPAAALLAVGLYSLVARYRGPIPLVARISVAVSAFGMTVLDAVNGLAVGLVLSETRSTSGIDAAALESVLNAVFGGPIIALTGLVTILAYLVAVVTIGVVLYRDGAPALALVALIGSTIGVVSHVGTTGAIGYALFFVAVAWLEFGWTAGADRIERSGDRLSPTAGDQDD